MSSWETQEGKRTHYIHVQGDQVVIGSHAGSGHTDNAGSFSFDQIREGGWDAHIERHFGAGVLAELKAAIGAPKKRVAKKKRVEPEPEWEELD